MRASVNVNPPLGLAYKGVPNHRGSGVLLYAFLGKTARS